MAEENKDGKPAATLDDLEKQVDAMEESSSGGEKTQSVLGAEDDNIEVVVVPESGRDDADGGGGPPERPADSAAADDAGDGSETTVDDDAELAGYSKSVRARIRREIELRKASESREDSERSLRIQAQTIARNSQLDQAEVTLAMLEKEEKSVESRLKEAKDKGKVDDDIALTKELGGLQAKRLEVERVRDDFKRTKPAQPNPLVVEWERKNRWFGNSEFAAESEAVKVISRQLAQKFPPTTPQHFEEVEKEMRRRVPNLAARVRARLGQDAIAWGGEKGGPGKEQPVRHGGPRLAAPSGGFGRPAGGQKRTIELTKSDLESMRRVRLDPNNRQHVLQYAREKAALER